jgi:hypothetical protein
MRIQITMVLLALLLFSAPRPAAAQSGEALRQQGLMQRDRGDVQGAIQTFSRMLTDYSYDHKLAAQAALELGDLYQALNQPVKARSYYDQIVNQFSDQTEVIASARKRQAMMDALSEVPQGWIMAGSKPSEYETAVDARNSFGGQSSVYLRSKKPEAEGFGTLMQNFAADQYLGKRVRLTGSVKSENVQNWSGLWMRVDGTRPQVLAFDNMSDRAIKGTTPWKAYDVVLDVPAGATGIAFGILLAGPGTVWLSGIKFEVVGDNVPITENRNSGAQAPTNLTFDSPLPGVGEIPKGWSLDGSKPADYAASLDSGNSYQGFPAVSIHSKKPQIDGFGTLDQGFSASSYAGRRVRFSAFVKSDNVLGWSGLWMRVDGKQVGMPLAFDNMQNRSVKGTTGWRNYEVVLDVPSDATNIALGILLDGTGTVWISAAKFEETNAPVTDIKKTTPQAPTNLGFDKK